MLARVFSCAVVGLEGVIVEVEVDYTNGLPGMTIVGLPGNPTNQTTSGAPMFVDYVRVYNR